MSGHRLSLDQQIQLWVGRIVIDAETGCWLWQGQRDRKGYALVHHRTGPRGSAIKRAHRLHRLLYERFVGGISAGYVLHHICKTPHCVYPKHVVPLTRSEHLEAHDRRGFMARLNKERAARTTRCANGHPWNEENTYLAPNGRSRFCRACGRERARRYWREKRYARQKAAT